MSQPNARLQAAIRKVETSGLFDARWYSACYPDVSLMNMSPAEHFVRLGSRLLRDPGPGFSVEAYLARYQDVARSGLDPFQHYLDFGLKEGRQVVASDLGPKSSENIAGPEPLTTKQLAVIRGMFEGNFESQVYRLEPGQGGFEHFRQDRQPLPSDGLGQIPYQPKVSVIVPNYNHARFLKRRIESILAQTYRNFDVLLLDDCSSDNSREVIADFCDRYPDRIRSVYNPRNAGNVFRQWRKGIEIVDGELVWICESDDFCEPDFLEKLVPCFSDRSVQIAFGRIQFADREGNPKAGLDGYRESAEPGIWETAFTRPAATWFARGFGTNNLIANVGGCLLRRQKLADRVWTDAETYCVLGDWFLYCHLAAGGQIAYSPDAVAYFRQHGDNTSVNAFSSPGYYLEHQRFMTMLRRRWDIPVETVDRFLASIFHQYTHFDVAREHGPFDQYVDRDALLAVESTEPHVLIAFLGFFAGEAESQAVHLANALQSVGARVSMLAYQHGGDDETMARELDPAVPVYHAAMIGPAGAGSFIKSAGVSLIHSHHVVIEPLLMEKPGAIDPALPYLVTLHGSYAACEMASDRVAKFAERVNHWTYTVEGSREPLRGLDLPETSLSKLPKAIASDPRPFPLDRPSLGIKPATVVFTLVARGIQRNGWRASIEAFRRLRQRRPDRDMRLLLCGEGTACEEQKMTHGDDPDISFLGSQTRISGLYRISDAAILPTRLVEASIPSSLIQAMQVGTPVIATRMGQIAEALGAGPDPAGLLIEPHRDTEQFIEALALAMDQMLDKPRRMALSRAAMAAAERFQMDNVVGMYQSLYKRLARQAPN